MTILWKEHRRPRWNQGGRHEFDADRTWEAAHPGHNTLHFGRCRSGRCWFWGVVDFGNDWAHHYGWADTENAEIERLVGDGDAFAARAGGILEEVNATKRAARPPPE